jgi:hypothetical protein
MVSNPTLSASYVPFKISVIALVPLTCDNFVQ